MTNLKYLNYAEKNGAETIRESEIKKWEFRYQTDLLNLDCCKITIADGCLLKLDNNKCCRMCNSCCVELFDELAKITASKAKVKLYSLSLGNFQYIISRNSVFIIFHKFEAYFLYLYGLHVRDDFYINNENLKKLIAKNSNSFFETDNDRKKVKRLNQADKRRYYIYKQIRQDLSICFNFPFEIKPLKTPQKIFIYSLIDFSVPCSFEKRKNAVMVVTDNSLRGFTFAFCTEHLYEFAKLLKKLYFNEVKGLVKIGCFSVEIHKVENPCCFFSDQKSQYKLKLDKCTVWLSRDALEMLAVSTLTSLVFKEFFPIQAQQFVTLAQKYNNKNLDEPFSPEYLEQKKEIANLKKKLRLKNKETQAALNYYNNLIEGKNSEITHLHNSKDELASEKHALETQIIGIESIHKDQISALKSKVLNCRQSHNEIINLGITQKKAKKNQVKVLKKTFIEGIQSSTLDEFGSRFSVIIETKRVNDAFCFALSLNDIDMILNGIQKVEKSKESYRNRKVGFTIYRNNSQSDHCYFCGDSENLKYSFTFNRVRFILCENCLSLFQEQLKDIKEEFIFKRGSGGFQKVEK